MANTVTFYVGDDRPDLSGTISVNDSPTLAGATVTLTAITAGGTKEIDAQSCTVDIDDSADTIGWEYAIQSSDFNTLGTFYIYLTVTYSDGDEQTVTAGTVTVRNPYG